MPLCAPRLSARSSLSFLLTLCLLPCPLVWVPLLQAHVSYSASLCADCASPASVCTQTCTHAPYTHTRSHAHISKHAHAHAQGLRRWHPDKFEQKFGALLLESERARVLAKVSPAPMEEERGGRGGKMIGRQDEEWNLRGRRRCPKVAWS